MKKDNVHNLSLDRISKLHALNIEKHFISVATAPTTSSAIAVTSTTSTANNSVAADAVSSVAVNVDHEKSARNSQKWQDMFNSLKQYKEVHGELSDIVVIVTL